MATRPEGEHDSKLLAKRAAVSLAFAMGGLALAHAVGVVALPAWLTVTTAVVALAFPALTVASGARSARRNADIADECRELRNRLNCDPLTGLMNRTAFDTSLDGLRGLASEASSVMVLFFDLDRFKEVNDRLGHRVGDRLLVEVARRASGALEDAVAVARLGGDEFAAIVPLHRHASPQDYGEAIVALLNEPFAIEDHSVQVAASVGIATGDPLLDDGHELLRRADVAMYEAKGAACGGCQMFDDNLSGRQLHESFVRAQLGRSLIEESLGLHYQPVLDARTGRFSSAEALLRAQSTDLQDVPTITLIEIAEKSGQIVPLTEWTLETVLQAIHSLETTPIAVNISPVYFRHPDFVHRILDRLVATGTRPDLLTIEITEGVLMADVEAAKYSIGRLRDVGIQVLLDDFGTCYSSLSYLQNFELDGLKLDKTFLRDVGHKKKATQVIKSMIDFGHSLDMRVVVEGVESDWQARLLQMLGADMLQGYEIGVPMPLEELRQYRDCQMAMRTDDARAFDAPAVPDEAKTASS